MNHNSRVLLTLFFLLAALATACFLLRPGVSLQEGKTHVYMLDIGQGDSFLIVVPDGRKILIDGGRDAAVLSELSKVMPAGDHAIDVMIATHPDADHIGGLPYVLQRYHVKLFLTAQVFTDTKTFASLYQELSKQHIPSYYARHGMTLTLDTVHPVTFSILFPDRDTSNWETNAASVVGRLQAGKRSMLLTGDSPSAVEHFLVEAERDDIDVDVLKLGHHGSKFSSSTEYLQATSPALGLVSAGINNTYGHPSAETIGRLHDLAIPWISTQQKGTVDMSTDGTAQWAWQSI